MEYGLQRRQTARLARHANQGGARESARVDLDRGEGARRNHHEVGHRGRTAQRVIRNGVTKDTLKVGEELVVRGYGARDGSNLLAGVKYERADGKEFWLGNEGAEATAKARGDVK